MQVSDSKSRGTWYHEGSGFAFGYAGQVDPLLRHQASPIAESKIRPGYAWRGQLY